MGRCMERRRVNADDAPPPIGGDAQALDITGAQRLSFISGQILVDTAGICGEAWLLEVEAIAAA